jgi:transcriptional regulator with XRE-family HTH domain
MSSVFTKMEETFTTNLAIIYSMELKDIIKSEMERRGLSIREFAKIVGVSHPTISDVLNGEKPSFDTCEKLAPILNLSLETVLRAAGLLPPVDKDTEYQEQFFHYLSQLSPQERQEILELLRFKAERQKNAKPPSRTPKPARSALKEG